MLEHVDSIVVGAGCVGLAVARRLALAGREVVVIEETDAIGTGTSSRNSEVVHAGIYYPEGSFKARLCVRGRHLLYDYLESRSIPHRRIGKMIVATEDAELPTLEDIGAKARANGVDDLEWIDGPRLLELEPNVRAAAAWLSPSTGIFDSHTYMLSLQGELEAAGGMVAFFAPVLSARVTDAGIVAETGGDAAMTLSCSTLVNAAGLGAQALAGRIDGMPADAVPPLYFARGHYFTLSGKCPFNHLVYPVPVAGGLGTHSSVDLGGQVKFGPDVEWIDKIDYTVDPARGEKFYGDIRRYWPGLPDGALQPGYAGIRPKLTGPEGGKYGADFMIQGPAVHGVPGLVNLYGIESPGLTSSLAIADEVAAMLGID